MIPFEPRVLGSNEGSQPVVCDLGLCRLALCWTSPASLGTVISVPKKMSETQGVKTWSFLPGDTSLPWVDPLGPHAGE